MPDYGDVLKIQPGDDIATVQTAHWQYGESRPVLCWLPYRAGDQAGWCLSHIAPNGTPCAVTFPDFTPEDDVEVLELCRRHMALHSRTPNLGRH